LFGLSARSLRGKSTQSAVAMPRSIAIYLTRQLTDATQTEIGRHFGGRHPSTVMRSIATIRDKRSTNAALNRVVLQLLESLGPASRL
jgi:chromosomal replication initiator protein